MYDTCSMIALTKTIFSKINPDFSLMWQNLVHGGEQQCGEQQCIAESLAQVHAYDSFANRTTATNNTSSRTSTLYTAQYELIAPRFSSFFSISL